MQTTIRSLVCLLALTSSLLRAAEPTQILIVVGPSNHPPGTHEVAAGGRLLQHCLENMTNVTGVQVRVVYEWPDKATRDAAATVVFIGDTFPPNRFPEVKRNLADLDEMMQRGCGLVCLHYATGLLGQDVAADGDHPLLGWLGGYFANNTCPHHPGIARIYPAATITPAASHPITRGWQEFTLHDEPYINNYFDKDNNQPASNVTVLATSILPPEAPKREPVAWCVARADGGRGFGIVMPHFYRNWTNADLRRFILNGIVWSAKREVPVGGVQTARPNLTQFNPVAEQPPRRLITPIPEKVSGAMVDKQDFQIPDRVQLTGWLGTRIMASETNRLVKLDTGRLLEGYRKRPGRQTWDGEHVGKWLHAATLAWVYTGDPVLRAKLDETAAELCKCQLEDGYLGTYENAKRWTSWDVWAHKYNLIGLVTYMRYTGNLTPLPTCRRMGDLLCRTFGDAPGQLDIVSSKVGGHAGMASTSVLEPMVLLHRFTGEQRYLDFCHYILRAWEQPNGPHIISRLLEHQGVDKVGNAKAYEMLSCLNGALELYRTTGNTNLLNAALNAWQDIVDRRLYITGAASCREHFQDEFDLPNNNNIGETCVTVTWLQFNAQLLRLTGEARFAEQLEHVALNQLLGAQQPDGAAWGYYVQMEGKKPYSATLDGHCCLSSGPRGIALLPTFAITTDSDGAVINLFDAGTAHLTLHDGTPVTLKVETLYPADGRIRITVEPKTRKEFSLKLRVPAWCQDYSLKPSGAKPGTDGYTTLRRQWKAGDVVELNLKLAPRLVIGDHLNQGKATMCYGPLVLAADEALLPATNASLNTLALAKPELAALGVTSEAAAAGRQTWPGARVFQVNATERCGDTPFKAMLIPFADAGATGARYRVWLPLAGEPDADVLLGGMESRSRPGNLTGSINDDDVNSGVVTFDGRTAAEDWFAVTLPRPVNIRRVVFLGGKIFHDGGWYDASQGKPRVQIQRTVGGEWQTLGELADYPATTATDSKGLQWGSNQFTLKLTTPATILAVRVIGVPASGDNPKQAFSSCAELRAFAD